jgi:hypothetical protein
MDELQLQMLRLIRDATAAGLIRWRQNQHDPEIFDAEPEACLPSFEGCLYIQFRYPAYNDDGGGSDRDYVRVGDDRFIIGTAGWWLALEILAAALPEWLEHWVNLRDGYRRRICELSAAIEKAKG